jgi:uncharacterized protein YfaQ (DUF2300 family)
MAVSFTSGCSTGSMGEQVVGRAGSAIWFKTASIQTQVNYYKKACLAYGVKDETAEMTQCIQAALQNDKDAARALESEISARSAERRAAKIAAERSTITCVTNGNVTTCN